MANKDVLTKEVLQEDEIIYEQEIQKKKPAGGGGGGIEAFFAKNRNMIYAVAGGIALLVVGIVWYRYSLQKKDVEAREVMIQAVKYFEQDSLNKAMVGDGANLGFESIVEDYGNTTTGNLAKFYLGACYLQSGRAADAVKTLEEYSTGSNFTSCIAMATLGWAYEETGEYDKAAEALEEAAATPGKNSFTTPFFLKEAGRNFEAAGKNEKALALYREIKKKYPASEEGQKIERNIARLSEDGE